MAAVNPDPLPEDPYDAAFYYNAARSLAGGDGYVRLDGETTNLYAPGYPLLLAGAISVYGDDLLSAKLLNVFFGAATVGLVYVIGARVATRAVGLTAAAILAVLPGQIIFTTVLMTEVVFAALASMLVLLIMLWTADRRPSSLQVLALGLLIGAMALIRTETLLLVPALAALWLFFAPSPRELARWLAVLAVGVTLPLVPWLARNYVEFDTLTLREGAPAALRIGLSPDFDEQLAGAFFAQEPPSYAELARYYRDYPLDAGIFVLRKWAYLFGHEDDLIRWLQWHQPPPLSSDAAARWADASVWSYYAVGLLAVGGTAGWLARLDRRRAVILWFVLSWASVFLLFAPQGRYHFPLVPMLSILAAYTLAGCWGFVRRQIAARTANVAAPERPALRWRAVLPVLAFALLVIALATTILRGFPDSEARTRDLLRQADLSRLSQALTDYSSEHDGFPSTGGLDRGEPLCALGAGAGCELRDVLKHDPPSDPLGTAEEHGYWYASDGDTAIIYARRETDEPWAGPACASPSALSDRGELQCVVVSRD
ncbi:MAG: glycosyltransferase family 39 protein [Dehalococcoidia bacterium]